MRTRAATFAFGLLVSALATAQAEVTKEQAQALGKELESAIKANGGPAKLRSLVDTDAFRERAKRGVKANAEQSAQFDRSIARLNLAPALIRQDSSFHLVAAYASGPPRLLFRRVHRENLALSYVELFLEEREGKVRVVDAAITGSYMSRQLRRQYQAMVGGDGMSKAFFRVVDMFRQRRFDQLLEAWENLSPAERKLEEMLVTRANALAQVEPYDKDAHLAAMKAVVEAHPKSLAALLSQVELFAGVGDVPATLAAIDRLEAVVPDPYLDMRRSLVFYEAGEKEKAQKWMKQALERDPRLRIEDEPGPTGPVADPVEAALIYIGVMGGALKPGQLDRIMDWKAFHALLGAKSADIKAMSVEDFARAYKANMAQRPKRLDAARLEALRPSLQAKIEGDLATVSAPVFRAPLKFHKVGEAWIFRGD
jgi:tetratricopeptide (TPR) repeat protein